MNLKLFVSIVICLNTIKIEKKRHFYLVFKKEKKKNLLTKKKNKKILQLLNNGMAIRVIMKIVKSSISRVHKVMKENGFICENRKKPKRVILE